MLNPTLFEENLQSIKEDIAINPSITNIKDHLRPYLTNPNDLDETARQIITLVNVVFRKETLFNGMNVSHPVMVHMEHRFIFLPDGTLLKDVGGENLDRIYYTVGEIQRKNIDRLLMYPMQEKPYTEIDGNTLTIKLQYTQDVLASAYGFWSYNDPFFWYTHNAAIVKIKFCKHEGLKPYVHVTSFPYGDKSPEKDSYSYLTPYSTRQGMPGHQNDPDLTEVCNDENNLYVDIYKKLKH